MSERREFYSSGLGDQRFLWNKRVPALIWECVMMEPDPVTLTIFFFFKCCLFFFGSRIVKMPPVSDHQHPDLTESRRARCSGAQRDAGLVGINILELLIILHHWFFFPPLCLLISLHCFMPSSHPTCVCTSEHVQNVIKTSRIYQLFERETFSSAPATDLFLCSRLYLNSHLAHNNNNRTVLGILRIH